MFQILITFTRTTSIVEQCCGPLWICESTWQPGEEIGYCYAFMTALMPFLFTKRRYSLCFCGLLMAFAASQMSIGIVKWICTSELRIKHNVSVAGSKKHKFYLIEFCSNMKTSQKSRKRMNIKICLERFGKNSNQRDACLMIELVSQPMRVFRR